MAEARVAGRVKSGCGLELEGKERWRGRRERVGKEKRKVAGGRAGEGEDRGERGEEQVELGHGRLGQLQGVARRGKERRRMRPGRRGKKEREKEEKKKERKRGEEKGKRTGWKGTFAKQKNKRRVAA